MKRTFQAGQKRRKAEIQPIWRGIGFLLVIVDILIASILTAIFIPILIGSGYVPPEIMGYVDFPAWVFRVPLLGNIAGFIHGINNLYLGIILFFAFLILLAAIFTMIYVSGLQFFGPPRYTEIDAPPSRYKAKKYKR